ncbi:MAG: DUF4199 domain-containing protein [Bacteroidales bacterium]|jgi:hypothetical protein
MEEKKTSMTTHALTYGVGTGLALIVYSLIMYVANLYMNKPMQYLAFVLLIGGMLIGTLQYRKTALNGFMTYGKAFSVNFLIGLFATILSSIFVYFYVKYINTGLIDEIMQQTRNKMEAKAGSMTQEQMDQALSMTQRFLTPVWMVIWSFIGNAFWSAVIALILSIFVKKDDPNAPKMV